MILKNVAAQGVYLYAYIPSTSTVDTGDAANITGYYTLDGTDHTGFGTANPTEIGNGVYWQPLAQGETNGNAISYRWTSTTSGVQIQPVFVLTSGVNLPTAAPGAANGVFIAGSNAATTFASLTVTTTTTLTGAVSLGSTLGVTGAVTFNSFVVTTTTTLTGAVSLGSTLGVTGTATFTAGITANITGNLSGSIGSITLTQALGAARALDSIADTSLTLNDALQCAVAAVTAQVDASGGTTCVFKTASTGTTLRTKALTLITPPATVPSKAV